MSTIAFSFTVPDEFAAKVRDDFCAQHGYRAFVPDPLNPGATIANPETKAAFLRRRVREFILQAVIDRNAELAARDAHSVSRATITRDITLT